MQKPGFDHRPKGNARQRFFGRGNLQILVLSRSDGINARLCYVHIGAVLFDTDKVTAKFFRHRAGGTGAKERVQHHITGIGGGQNHPVQ